MDTLFSTLRVFLSDRRRSRRFSRGGYYYRRSSSYHHHPKPPCSSVFSGQQRRQSLKFCLTRKAYLLQKALAAQTHEDTSLVATVRAINPHISDNAQTHHTNKFNLVNRVREPRLVIRRGQEFFIELLLSRPFDFRKDALSLIFVFAAADRPSHGQKSLVAIPVLQKGQYSGYVWSAEIDSESDNILKITITTAPDCLVGEWRLEVDTKLINGPAVCFNYEHPIYILFNPWCIDDTVYLEPENERTEYVLTDTGLIGRGTSRSNQASVWKYAQFEDNILECSLYLLTGVAKVGIGDLGDPVLIARAISAAVNSQDDNGVMMGNWTTDHYGGVHPTRWLGSMVIMQEYWRTRRPIKFGQCWVFAGLLTTIGRAIGIPTRCTTNYSSAHDTQNSMTVDIFVDDYGQPMDSLNTDSVWNFHVWNEMWMKRTDLSEAGEQDGWQVVDSTPQEKSDGIYRCGPAPVKSIKKGDIKKPYDTSFVYAEVNADKVYWKYSGPTQPLKLLRRDTVGIGDLICTKAVGKWVLENITREYKYPEKSAEERAVMLKTLRQSESHFSRYLLNEEFHDINFNFAIRDDIMIGSPFTVALVIKNGSRKKDHRVAVTLRIDCTNYLGKPEEFVKKEKFDCFIRGGAVEEVKLHVTYDDYGRRLSDQCSFLASCLAKVADTNFEHFAQEDFRLKKPDIRFEIEGKAVQGEELQIEASFINPLPIPIKKGEFNFEGPRLANQLKLKLPDVVFPSDMAKVAFRYLPLTAESLTIIAKFSSKELSDVDGYLTVDAAPSSAEVT